jgi:hypothetical protein
MANRRPLISVVIVIILAIAVVFWLMSREQKFMPATVESSNGSTYSLLLPDRMEPAHFGDNASLQYEDRNAELYTMIIDESKAKIISFDLDYDLETYMKISSHTIDSAGVYVNKPLEINGNKALQTEIRKKINGKDIVYRLTCIETPKYFYQLLVWTIASRYDSNKEEMDTIISSFKETGQVKGGADSARK